MTLDELNDFQVKVKSDYMKVLNNIQSYFGNEMKCFETKKDILKSTTEIFETSLRLIEQEKARINGGKR